MASSLQDGPPNPSFAIRGPKPLFPRSLSTKEWPRPDTLCLPLPPRLSANAAATLSLQERDFHAPPTPRLSFTPETSNGDCGDAVEYYRCVSSVLKKDGQVLCVAASNGIVYTGSLSNVIRVWKLPEFAELGQIKTKACIVVALQVDNDKVYAAYADCKIRVWRRTSDDGVRHVRIGTLPTAASFFRGYIGGRDRMIKHLGPISCLAINAAEDILYSSSFDRTVKVWRVSDFCCIETIQAHTEPINAVAVSEEGVLYTASDDATVRVWRRNFCSGGRAHSLTITLPTKYSPVKTLALTSDAAVLYGGCSDGYVHYWLKSWFSGQLQYGGALAGHTHAVLCLSTVSNYVVSGSADLTSRVWSRRMDGLHSCVAVLRGHRGPVRCVAAVPFSEEMGDESFTFCTGSLDGVVKVWRIRNTATQQSVGQHKSGEY